MYVQNNASRTETRENVLSTAADKKNFQRLPRAPHCTDRARISINVSGRAFAVSTCRLHSVSPKSACTTRYVRKNTKNPQTYVRSSTMHLRQVLSCEPGLGFSPPAIVPNITRLSNRSLLYRAKAPAEKSRRLRMVVSMFSQRVILRAFAYERVVWSV